MLKYYNTTFSVPSLAAGAHGYWQVSISVSGQIVSISALTNNIAFSGGLQVTPIYVDSSSLYLNYYAPSAISAGQVTLNIRVIFDSR